MGRIVDSFSYSVNDAFIIQKARKIAKDDGIDFAKYVTALIKQDVSRYGAIAGEPATHSEAPESVRENTHIKPSRLSVREFKRWMDIINATDDADYLGITVSGGFDELREQIRLLSMNASNRANIKRRNPAPAKRAQ